MVDKSPIRKAVDTAWSIYLATHTGVDSADDRRCLLERHLDEKREACEGDAEELACLGLAYLERLPDDVC